MIGYTFRMLAEWIGEGVFREDPADGQALFER
jgi:hypothetical protein